MKAYTIGIYFNDMMNRVVLILKNRPEWQAGKFNLPGGHIEENEKGIDCIVREFKEECNINTINKDWKYIGDIRNDGYYKVEIFSTIQKPEHGDIQTMEDQEVVWVDIDKLPKNTISNLYWLIPFAYNCWKQGNADNLNFGIFNYNYLK